MNSKSTWVWITIAAVLFAAVFGVEKYGRKPAPELVALIPDFKAASVTAVQFFASAGRLDIRAERTNKNWRLVNPILYPAQAASIEGLLLALQQLAPAHTISGEEVRQRKNADEEFGFATRTMLTLYSGEQSKQLLIGALTAHGDQIYVQVVGGDSVFVVDARLLQLLPSKTDDWRDTGLVDLRNLVFDRIVVSNATAALQLQREGSNGLWRLAVPIQARADNQRLLESLQKLHATRVAAFVTDDARTDADSFGFQNPELELTLAQGTNVLVTLQFGKSPTNDSTLVYARRNGLASVVTVERQSLASWFGPLNQFRDPRLVSVTRPVEEIEIRGAENFTFQRASTNTWKLVDSDLPVDSRLVGEFLLALVTSPITDFKSDSLTAVDLPKYGLAEPSRQIVLRTRSASGTTNTTLAELSVGDVNAGDGVAYVRRADEPNSVYAIGIVDYARLVRASWRFRERKIWQFSETNVVRVTVLREGQKSEVRRLEANTWAFPPGTPGIPNGAGVEETVHRFGELAVSEWVDRGEEKRAQFGFSTNSMLVIFELKDGTKHELEFGGESPDKYPYAAVKLDGQTWFFECPLAPFKFLEFYLLKPQASQ